MEIIAADRATIEGRHVEGNIEMKQKFRFRRSHFLLFRDNYADAEKLYDLSSFLDPPFFASSSLALLNMLCLPSFKCTSILFENKKYNFVKLKK